MAFKPPITKPARSQEKRELALSSSDLFKDEGYFSPHKDSIWDEVVSQLGKPIRYTWESYGCGPAEKEKPFLSELGDLGSLWVENLESLYISKMPFPSYRIINNQMKPRKVVIRDLKLLLGNVFFCYSFCITLMPSQLIGVPLKGIFIVFYYYHLINVLNYIDRTKSTNYQKHT